MPTLFDETRNLIRESEIACERLGAHMGTLDEAVEALLRTREALDELSRSHIADESPPTPLEIALESSVRH